MNSVYILFLLHHPCLHHHDHVWVGFFWRHDWCETKTNILQQIKDDAIITNTPLHVPMKGTYFSNFGLFLETWSQFGRCIMIQSFVFKKPSRHSVWKSVATVTVHGGPQYVRQSRAESAGEPGAQSGVSRLKVEQSVSVCISVPWPWPCRRNLMIMMADQSVSVSSVRRRLFDLNRMHSHSVDQGLFVIKMPGSMSQHCRRLHSLRSSACMVFYQQDV